MDMASIQAAMTGLNAAANIGGALLKLVSGTEIQTKVIELNTQILAAQTSALAANSDQFALLQEVREMKEELARVKAWEAEKQKYELHRYPTGSFCYSIKDAMRGSEPPHEICANCYEQGKKRILQRQNHLFVFCPNCKTVLQDKTDRPTFG
ncbi:MAG TPA: hypothetical protein VHZ29_19300 [Rhizomicrobium sp.]|jgi:hypothetical protein|nr:hypothetical protein [Rhizomicrobium sp.]